MILLGEKCNLIDKLHSNPGNISQASPIIQNTINFGLLPRTVSILLKIALNFWNPFINATARFHMSFHLLFIILDYRAFSDHDLRPMLDQSPPMIETPNINPHLIFYSAFVLTVAVPILPSTHIFTLKDAG